LSALGRIRLLQGKSARELKIEALKPASLKMGAQKRDGQSQWRNRLSHTKREVGRFSRVLARTERR
jgi:hypothetical protein